MLNLIFLHDISFPDIQLLKNCGGDYVPVDVYVFECEESTGTDGVECVCGQGPHDTLGY